MYASRLLRLPYGEMSAISLTFLSHDQFLGSSSKLHIFSHGFLFQCFLFSSNSSLTLNYISRILYICPLIWLPILSTVSNLVGIKIAWLSYTTFCNIAHHRSLANLCIWVRKTTESHGTSMSALWVMNKAPLRRDQNPGFQHCWD